MIVGHILFDGVNHAEIGELGGFDGHRARAGADVPDDAAGLNIELSQSDGPQFGLSNKAALGTALGEDLVGVAEAAKAAGSALLVRPARLALENHHIERCKLQLLNFYQLPFRDTFVSRAEVSAY